MTQLGYQPDLVATLAKRLDRIERELNHVRSLSSLSAGGGSIGQYAQMAVFRLTGIADNSATPIFTVTTTNETGDVDGGAWSLWCIAHTGNNIAPNASDDAAMQDIFSVTHVNEEDGNAVTTVDDWHQSAVAATAGGSYSIGSVTPTATATSNYVTTINLTIDCTGIFAGTASAVCFVVLTWEGYSTAPVMAAA